MSSFHLTSNERKGLLGAVLLAIIIIIFKFINYSLDQSYILRAENEMIEKKDSLKLITPIIVKYDSSYKKISKENKLILNPVKFNPNFANVNQWEEIGLSKLISVRIYKYIKLKNGIRNSVELLSVYGFKKEWLLQIKDSLVFVNPKVDIQKASISDLISIKGIGEKYAKRIVKYRESLGGYFSIEQLREVYGIDSTLFASISNQVICSTDMTKLIDVNYIGYNDMCKHPYITKKEALKIIVIRSKNRKINLDDLQDVFTVVKFKKIKKYLKW